MECIRGVNFAERPTIKICYKPLKEDEIILNRSHIYATACLPSRRVIEAKYSSVLLMFEALIDSISNSTESSRITLFIPLFRPGSGANRIRITAKGHTFLLVRLLLAQNPFIVAIPAVQCLIGTGETIVTRCCSGILQNL